MSRIKDNDTDGGEQSCWMCSCGAMNAVGKSCYRCESTNLNSSGTKKPPTVVVPSGRLILASGHLIDNTRPQPQASGWEKKFDKLFLISDEDGMEKESLGGNYLEVKSFIRQHLSPKSLGMESNNPMDCTDESSAQSSNKNWKVSHENDEGRFSKDNKMA